MEPLDKLFVKFRKGDAVKHKDHGSFYVSKILENGDLQVDNIVFKPDGFELVERVITAEEMDYVRQLQDLFDGVIFEKQDTDLVEYQIKSKDSHLK